MDFEKVYVRYFQVIYRFLLSLSADEHLSEELAQEAFMKAMKNAGQFEGRCAPETWLCAIAKNCYFDHQRAQKHRFQGDMPDIAAPSFEEALEDKETRLLIHRALHELPEPYKEVFTLRVFGDLSYAQIGALFGKSETWGRVTYYRAKVKLRETLKEDDNATQ
mgnify:CR=1 FL=1|jgi:RNA polymerase sigma-70 factor (ECF subfamily)